MAELEEPVRFEILMTPSAGIDVVEISLAMQLRVCRPRDNRSSCEWACRQN